MLTVPVLLAPTPPAEAADPVIGSSGACSDFKLEVLGFLDFDITDEGWVWVRRSHPELPVFRSVSGSVLESHVARNDTPANHNSHDQNTEILVDEADRDVLSNVNRPNTTGRDDTEADNGDDDLTEPRELEMEWEIGTFPNEKGQSVPQRYFPRWAWPNVGDRVWTNGHWVFDCGHAKEIGHYLSPLLFVHDDYWRSEIHPPRAIASMRNQADTLPGTGTTRVPVTATDLYVHGEAGFVTDVLNCGMHIIVDGVNGIPEIVEDPDDCPTKTSPIAADFQFEICLPPRPTPGAELVWRIENGPANTVGGHQVGLVPGTASTRCANDGNDDDTLYDAVTSLQATVPLAGTGVGDVEVYARRIVAGWVMPPATPLTHLRMTLDNLNLHVSGDGGIIASDDGELTFFFVDVDKAPNEWIRLADYAPTFDSGNSKMNDYDPSLFGDSFMPLGALFDFYVRNGAPVQIESTVYDQDCYDGHFGQHVLSTGTYVSCALDIDETGNNDSLDAVEVELTAPNYGSDPAAGVGDCPGVAGGTGSAPCNVTSPFKPRIRSVSPLEIVPRPDYELNFTLEKLPLADEDTADLRVTKACAHDGEVLVVGVPLRCTITVANPGPGLPRGVVVTDTLSGSVPAAQVTIGTPTVTGVPAGAASCAVTATGFTCTLDTLRVGGSASIDVAVTPRAAGSLSNRAAVSTASTDPQSANDAGRSDAEVFLPVTIDVKPGEGAAPINVTARGVTPVAVITTPTFDASTLVSSSICFGDSGAPAERDCTEARGGGKLQDVDRDRDADLVSQYETLETGIDLGDTTACLTGTTRGGIHVYGCDAIVTRP